MSLTLFDLVLTQQANPEPPVGRIPRLDASVHWRALLSWKLVADFALDRPKLYVNLAHLRAEAADPQPVAKHGWQEALQAIYPLKINRFRIVNGDATYVDDGPFEPLELTAIDLVADNIRNIRSREREYPSPVHLDAVAFKKGKVTIDGHADFLAEPHLGIKADVALDGIELDYFKPVTRRYNVAVNKGMLSASGKVEYAPTIKVVDLEQSTIRGVQVEYTHTPAQKGVVQEATAKTVKAAREASNEPGLSGGERNAGRGQHRRLRQHGRETAISRVHLPGQPDPDQLLEPARGRRHGGEADGQIHGHRRCAVTARFRPEQKGPDFDLNMSLENTDLRTLNDVLRAYGKFDVAGGTSRCSRSSR